MDLLNHNKMDWLIMPNRKINITNEGFLYAVSQPQKFADVMKSKIDPLLIK